MWTTPQAQETERFLGVGEVQSVPTANQTRYCFDSYQGNEYLGHSMFLIQNCPELTF